MKIHYKLSLEEYLKAVNFHHEQNHSLIKLITYITLATGIVLVGTDFTNTAQSITNILAAFFSIAFYILFRNILSVYQAKNVYTKSAVLAYNITLYISGKGIRLDKKGKEKIIRWSAFIKWKKNEAFYLLYTTPRQFNVIPLRVMSSKQVDEFEGYLKKYLGK